jgi:hypothetical protein
MQRMYKHGFCRRHNVGIRRLVYTPHWLSRDQIPSLRHDLMGSRFRVTLTLAIRHCPDWGITWTPGRELRAEKQEVAPDAELLLFRRRGDKRLAGAWHSGDTAAVARPVGTGGGRLPRRPGRDDSDIILLPDQLEGS